MATNLGELTSFNLPPLQCQGEAAGPEGSQAAPGRHIQPAQGTLRVRVQLNPSRALSPWLTQMLGLQVVKRGSVGAYGGMLRFLST